MNRSVMRVAMALCASMPHLKADRIWLRDGAVLEAEVTGISEARAGIAAPWLAEPVFVPTARIQEWVPGAEQGKVQPPDVQVFLTDGGSLSGKWIREGEAGPEVETAWGRRIRIPVDAVRGVHHLPPPDVRLAGGPLRADDWEITFKKQGYARVPRPPLEIAGTMQVFSLSGTTLARRIPYRPQTHTRIRFHVPRDAHPGWTLTFFSERKTPYGEGALHVVKGREKLILIPFSGPYGGFDLTEHSMENDPPYEFEVFADRLSGRVSVYVNGRAVHTWTRPPVAPGQAPKEEWFVLSGNAFPFYIDLFEVKIWDGETFPEPRAPLPPPENFRDRAWLRLSATGDLLSGDRLEYDGRRFLLTSDTFPEGIPIPKAQVGLVHFHSPETIPREDAAFEPDPPWELALRSGVRFPVEIEAWTETGLRVRSKWTPDPFTVKWDALLELGHHRYDPGDRAPAMRMGYRDGSRLAGEPEAVSGQDLSFRTPWGQVLTSPAGRMERWDHIGRRRQLISGLYSPGGIMGYSGQKKEAAFQPGHPLRTRNMGMFMDPSNFPKMFRICVTLESAGVPMHFGLNFWGKDNTWDKPEWLSIKLLDGPEPSLQFETWKDVVVVPLPMRTGGIHDFDFRLDLERGRAQVWVDGEYRLETKLPEAFGVNVDNVYLYDTNWSTFWIHDFRLYGLTKWPEVPDGDAPAEKSANVPHIEDIRNGRMRVSYPPGGRERTIPVGGIERIVFPKTGEEEPQDADARDPVEVLAPWAGTRLRLRSLELKDGIFRGKGPNWKEELRLPVEAVMRIRFHDGLQREDDSGLWPWVPLFSSSIELEERK